MDAVTDLLQTGALEFTAAASLTVALGVPIAALFWGAVKLISFLKLLIADKTRPGDYY